MIYTSFGESVGLNNSWPNQIAHRYDHCATCYGDGLQVIMGTTFGKGNLKKTHKGKWAVTVVDKATNRAVRVTPKAEAMLNNKKTAFFTDYRMLGKPASTVPSDVVDPLVNGVMNAPDEKLLNISPIFEYKLEPLSLIHISEPTRLGMSSYA